MALAPLIIESSEVTPEVILDKECNVFIFKGKSLPENPMVFYRPVLNWIDEYAMQPNENTQVSFKMIYFNTSSSKIFLDIMKKFESINRAGNKCCINWYYKDDDEEILEAGEIYAERVSLPFNLTVED
ncbi:MAG: DUF1987 domain-containing protein [Salinivirgaceae bacterium]|nr:DUF1987 domain-containing protein [Salinivirgaceae bacterium]